MARIFRAWIEENHKESKATVDSFFSEIGEVYDDICETEFKKHMTSASSVDFVKIFDKYMEFLRHEIRYQVLVVLPRYGRDSPKTFESIEGRQMGNTLFSNKEHDSIVLCIRQRELCKIFIFLSIRNVSP